MHDTFEIGKKKLFFEGNLVFWAGEENSAKKAVSNPWKLVKAAMAQDKIHWLDGFLVFDSWRKFDQKEDYVRQFRTIAAKARYVLREVGIKEAGMICDSDGVSWVWFPKGKRPTSNITEAVQLAQKGKVAFRKGDSIAALASMKAAYELWPDAATLCQALMGAEALPIEMPDSEQFFVDLSKLLDNYETTLIGAIVKVSHKANHRLQGIKFDDCERSLVRWIVEIAKIREVMALIRESGFTESHEIDGKTKRFARLADTFVHSYGPDGKSHPTDTPESTAIEKEKNALLDKLCACQLVREAAKHTTDYFEQLRHLGIRTEDVNTHLQAGVFDFLLGEPKPIVPSGHIVGRLNQHLRIFVQAQYTTRELKNSLASEKIDYGQIQHKILTLLKQVGRTADIYERKVGQAVGTLISIRKRAPEGLRKHICSFDTLIADRIQDFMGRDFVFKAIEKFTQKNKSGYFLIYGDPGIGKSSVAAKLVDERDYVHHFNSRADGRNNTTVFLKNICAQLIVTYGLNYDSLPVEASEDNRFLMNLLDEISAKLNADEKAVIIVDGLDEVDDIGIQSGLNMLSLPHVIPEGIFVVATTRRQPLALRIDCDLGKLDLKSKSPENLEDVEEYLKDRAKSTGIQAYIKRQKLSTQEFVSVMIDRSEGNFMYLRYVLPEIEDGAYKNLEFKDMPTGLQNYYEDHWRRMGMMASPPPKSKIQIIYVLSEITRPISTEYLAICCKQDEFEVQAVLDVWAQFLHEYDAGDSFRYSIYHSSFCEFLNRKRIIQTAGISITSINQLLGDWLYKEYYAE